MGLIRLTRGLTRPIRATAQRMNAAADVSRRRFLAGSVGGAAYLELLRKHKVQMREFEEVPAIGGGMSLESEIEPGLWFPDDVNAGQLSSYPCEENSSDAAYADQYRILNQNPVAVTAVPIQLALENRKRKEMFLVNVSTSTILIAFGFVPTTTIYTLPLQACGLANDGTGGIIIDQAWQGTVWAILQAGAAGNGSMLFTELPE